MRHVSAPRFSGPDVDHPLLQTSLGTGSLEPVPNLRHLIDAGNVNISNAEHQGPLRWSTIWETSSDFSNTNDESCDTSPCVYSVSKIGLVSLAFGFHMLCVNSLRCGIPSRTGHVKPSLAAAMLPCPLPSQRHVPCDRHQVHDQSCGANCLLERWSADQDSALELLFSIGHGRVLVLLLEIIVIILIVIFILIKVLGCLGKINRLATSAAADDVVFVDLLHVVLVCFLHFACQRSVPTCAMINLVRREHTFGLGDMSVTER